MPPMTAAPPPPIATPCVKVCIIDGESGQVSMTPTERIATAKAASDASSFSGFASLSPLFRGGNSHIQNQDFFPLAWVGASWQGKIFSGRVTACISCHGVQEGPFLNRIEIVEAAAREQREKRPR